MVTLPLLVTSTLFLIPTVIGFAKRHIKDATGMLVLTGLSIWNHGTNNPLALVIDRAYAHTFAIIYGIRSFKLCRRPKRRVADLAIFGIYSCGVVLYAFEINQLQVVLHFGLHVCTITAFSLYMITKDADNTNSNSTPTLKIS